MTALVLFLVVISISGIGLAFYYWRQLQGFEQKPDTASYISGLKSIMRGKDEQAFASLKEAVSADSDNIDGYLQLGNIFRRMNKPEQALDVHRNLTFRHDLTGEEKKEILDALYHDFLTLDDRESAEKAIGEIVELFPRDRWALRRLLSSLEKKEEWKDTAAILKKIDKQTGEESKSRLALYKVFAGNQLIEKGDAHRARLFFKEAIHFDKNCLAAYIAIGDSYYKESRLEDALGYWTKVITINPDKGQYVFDRLKKGFFEVGRYGEYAEALSNLLTSRPDHLTARLELAYFNERKGDIQAAREHFVAAFDDHSDSMMARLGLYRLNRDDGKKEKAETVFKQVMKLAVKKEAGDFICKQCGLHSENMIWLCHRCHAIESFDPVRS